MAVGEWDQRQLCPDGGCVGVIGPDGTCKACGRAAVNWGDERKRGLIDPEDDEDDNGETDHDVEDDEEEEYVPGHNVGYDDDDDEEAEDVPEAAAVASTSPNDWIARRLCPDGACIGLIGLDGRCKVCGRTASGSKEPAVAEPTAADPAVAEPAPAALVAGPAAAGTSPADTAGIAGESPNAPASGLVPAESTLVPCSDPACAGVLDRDGHCNVCGKVVA